ncbi:hypothetical protein EON64_17650 [archaeon]|nr:MAG: hypothetical protein EON64_17650 [archaeon]
MQFFPWSYRNTYFLLTSPDCLGIGGGGNYAIYLDGDLHRGTSGPCETFASPCLAADEEFACMACELFALTQPKLF